MVHYNKTKIKAKIENNKKNILYYNVFLCVSSKGVKLCILQKTK